LITATSPGNARIVTVTVNNEVRRGITDDRTLLVDFIRHELLLTGTHVGCEHGVCGACTVEFNGELIRSCLLFAVQANGGEINTIEGLARSSETLHPIQMAFMENHALQCAFCTSGFVLTTKALLNANPDPSESEIREALSGNICRCTGYAGIVAAVKAAAVSIRERNLRA
jgi:aerobic-type carbon monoxide dehydrogenase small subunit (CoxS/CutS family)